MKQLLSLALALLPCLAYAQYPSNGNQKINLGEQTTADGLIWRGVLNDTFLINPSSDTSAYIILDTVNNRFYNYNRATNVWSVAGGGTAVTSITAGTGLTGGTITTTGTLAADTSFLFTQSDTLGLNLTSRFAAKQNSLTLTTTGTSGAATLTGATLNIPQYSGGGGGVDSTAIKYVNTYGTQTVNGAKTFTTAPTFSTALLGGSGGTGITSFGAANRIPYASSTTALTTSANIVFIGDSALTLTKDAFIGGQRIGRGKNNTITTNISFGANSLNSITTGNFNTGLGVNTLKLVTNGVRNTAVGYGALENTTGNYNAGFGFYAAQAITSGSNNVAFGTESLYNLTTANFNMAIGYRSLYNNNGDGNIAIGYFSGSQVTTGTNNTMIGYEAGYANNSANATTTGSNNIIIGNSSIASSASVSNEITLGNSSITTIRAQVTSIQSLSDIRDKTNIMPLNYGIDFIKKLNPVSFDWDMRDGGKIGISEIGFIAQDLQQAQIDSKINIPNLVSDVNPDKLEASYGVLIPIMVKAIKEQQVLIDELKQRILNLENK